MGTTDVLIVCALKDELDALLDVRGGVSAGWTLEAGDPDYWTATLDGSRGPVRVAAARATAMGGVVTAELVTRLAMQLQPHCLAMCGVCAGHPDDTDLGDVIIADRVFQHDNGKLIRDGFRGDLTTHMPDDRWVRVAQDFAGAAEGIPGYAEPNEDAARWWFLERLYTDRNPLSSGFGRYFPAERRAMALEDLLDEQIVTLKSDDFSLAESGRVLAARRRMIHGVPVAEVPYHIHVGPIGSGNYVQARFEEWDLIANRGMRKLAGVEMEVAAIGAVAYRQRKPFVVAKGVMDHGDHHKTDHFKAFAARASAEVLCIFLRRVIVPAPASESAVSIAPTEPEKVPVPLAENEARVPREAVEGSSAEDLEPINHERWWYGRTVVFPSIVAAVGITALAMLSFYSGGPGEDHTVMQIETCSIQCNGCDGITQAWLLQAGDAHTVDVDGTQITFRCVDPGTPYTLVIEIEKSGNRYYLSKENAGRTTRHSIDIASFSASPSVDVEAIGSSANLDDSDSLRSANTLLQQCSATNTLACVQAANLYTALSEELAGDLKFVELYEKACGWGNSQGCFAAADLFHFAAESGVVDYDLAGALYRSGCSVGHPQACNRLGVMISENLVPGKDETEPLAMYIKACELDDAQGCANAAIKAAALGYEAGSMMYYGRACVLGGKRACMYIGIWPKGGLGQPGYELE